MTKKTKHAILVSVLAAIFMGLLCIYVNSKEGQFEMNGYSYYQVGVMEQKINGDTIYLPIYRRK